jgi:hypothetical protein
VCVCVLCVCVCVLCVYQGRAMHGSVHKDEMESQCAYRQASLLERFLQLHRVQLLHVLERKKGPGKKV